MTPQESAIAISASMETLNHCIEKLESTPKCTKAARILRAERIRLHLTKETHADLRSHQGQPVRPHRGNAGVSDLFKRAIARLPESVWNAVSWCFIFTMFAAILAMLPGAIDKHLAYQAVAWERSDDSSEIARF